MLPSIAEQIAERQRVGCVAAFPMASGCIYPWFIPAESITDAISWHGYGAVGRRCASLRMQSCRKCASTGQRHSAAISSTARFCLFPRLPKGQTQAVGVRGWFLPSPAHCGLPSRGQLAALPLCPSGSREELPLSSPIVEIHATCDGESSPCKPMLSTSKTKNVFMLLVLSFLKGDWRHTHDSLPQSPVLPCARLSALSVCPAIALMRRHRRTASSSRCLARISSSWQAVSSIVNSPSSVHQQECPALEPASP